MRGLEPTDTARDLLRLDLHIAKLLSVIVRQLVHGLEADVETGLGVINGKDIDRAVLVGQLPARATLGRVPTWHVSEMSGNPARDSCTEGRAPTFHGLGATNVREVGQGSERLVS